MFLVSWLTLFKEIYILSGRHCLQHVTIRINIVWVEYWHYFPCITYNEVYHIQFNKTIAPHFFLTGCFQWRCYPLNHFYIYSLLYDIPAIFSHFQIKVNTPVVMVDVYSRNCVDNICTCQACASQSHWWNSVKCVLCKVVCLFDVLAFVHFRFGSADL